MLCLKADLDKAKKELQEVYERLKRKEQAARKNLPQITDASIQCDLSAPFDDQEVGRALEDKCVQVSEC